MRELDDAYKTARRKMGLPVAIVGEEQLEREIEATALGTFWLELLPDLAGDTTVDQIRGDLESPVYREIAEVAAKVAWVEERNWREENGESMVGFREHTIRFVLFGARAFARLAAKQAGRVPVQELPEMLAHRVECKWKGR